MALEANNTLLSVPERDKVRDRPLSIAEAITQLEMGCFKTGTSVDLGQGRTAAFSDFGDFKSLVQRLRGHRTLLAVATGQVGFPGRQRAGPLYLCQEAEDMLRAAKGRSKVR